MTKHEAIAELVVRTIKSALAPVYDRQAALGEAQARLHDQVVSLDPLRERVVTLEAKADPVPMSELAKQIAALEQASLTSVKAEDLTVHGDSLMKSAITPIDVRVRAIDEQIATIRQADETLRAEVGALREKALSAVGLTVEDLTVHADVLLRKELGAIAPQRVIRTAIRDKVTGRIQSVIEESR